VVTVKNRTEKRAVAKGSGRKMNEGVGVIALVQICGKNFHEKRNIETGGELPVSSTEGERGRWLTKKNGGKE